MNATKLARQLESAKRDRKGSFRESLYLSPGRHVMCETKSQYDWWSQFKEALEKRHITPREFSIADLFESLVKDGRELRRLFNPNLGPSNILHEAAGAITSSDFSSITGQIVYTAMMEDLTPEQFPFQALIPTQQTQFSGEKIPGIAGLGDRAEVVPENEEYPLVGTGEDFIETPATTKRGFIVPVTKEAIFFDRTGQVLAKAGAVGESLRLNKEKRAIDCLIDENTTTHRFKWRGTTYASYQTTTPWDNVTATNSLVDWTDIDNANQTLNGILDPNTGEPVTIEADTLICVKALEETANRIARAINITVYSDGFATSGQQTATTAPNPMASSYQVVSSRLLAARLATDTSWFYGNPRKYAKYMENWGITVTQAPAGNSDDFNRDIVAKFKCSERGQYAVIQPRVMTTCTAA